MSALETQPRDRYLLLPEFGKAWADLNKVIANASCASKRVDAGNLARLEAGRTLDAPYPNPSVEGARCLLESSRRVWTRCIQDWTARADAAYRDSGEDALRYDSMVHQKVADAFSTLSGRIVS